MVDRARKVCYKDCDTSKDKKEDLMAYTLEDDEIAILIKPFGNGRIGTCICKSDDHILEKEQLSDAMGVALAMVGLFEIMNDDEEDLYSNVKEELEYKVQKLLRDNEIEEEKEPVYTTDGNLITLNAFTKTKGNC